MDWMPCTNPSRPYIRLAFTYSLRWSLKRSVKQRTWTGSFAFSTNESAGSVMVTGSQSRVWNGPNYHKRCKWKIVLKLNRHDGPCRQEEWVPYSPKFRRVNVAFKTLYIYATYMLSLWYGGVVRIIGAPIFDWFMVKWGAKNKHHKDMCLNKTVWTTLSIITTTTLIILISVCYCFGVTRCSNYKLMRM